MQNSIKILSKSCIILGFSNIHISLVIFVSQKNCNYKLISNYQEIVSVANPIKAVINSV